MKRGEDSGVRSIRRNADVVIVVVLSLVVAMVLIGAEGERRDAADAAYDEVVDAAVAQVDTWLEGHLARQRALAFDTPTAEELAAALAPDYVAFALSLDGEATVLATYPARPDIGPGTDLGGAFPHIDAVVDGAEEAFWASDAATTPSGSVAVTAVQGPGNPPQILTFAFDMGDTTLPRLLGAGLDRLDGSSFAIVDRGTGVSVLRSAGDGDDNRVATDIAGWQLVVAAPTASIDALVGGVVSWPARFLGAAVVVALWAGMVVRRRRLVASDGFGDFQLFDTASTPAMLVDADRLTVVRSNRAMADLTGASSPRQLEGAGLHAVLVSEGVDRDARGDTAAGAPPVDLDGAMAGEPVHEERAYWMQGEQRWGRVTARRVDSSSAGPLALVEIHDLDAERQREAMLERQRRALQDMAGRVSHDLRTPITAMIGFAELLQRSPDAPAEVRSEWASRLAANARELGGHVRDMAEVSAELAERPKTDVRSCAARAVRLHDSALHGVGAEVVNDVPEGLRVVMPELLLRQVLANLVDNAVKYRDRDRPLVLRIDAREDDEGMVEVRVSDNGIGVAPDQRERVFAGARGAAGAAGSGVGLATCRMLIEDFGGTLGLTDTDPHGSTFILWLPAESAPWSGASRLGPVAASGIGGDEQELIDHLPISVLILDASRALVRANRTAVVENGWTLDALVDDAWIDHLPDDGVRALALDALFSGRTQSWESADGDTAGLVVALEGGPYDQGALLLSWPRAAASRAEPVPDELTGLPDRVVVRDRLVRALREGAASDHSTAVLTVDLDDFATLNQRKGLSAGDQVLQAVADRLRASAVDEDAVARQGADEFVVVRPGVVGRDEAQRVAERLRAHIAAPITLADGQVVTITCSVGVALAGRDHDPDLLLIAAAQALHEARQNAQHTALVEVG